MTEFNFYPVFVADQVLTADHLNEIVNYLDEQDRLTRNKLIGIGIVCGLELTVSDGQIQISEGCGVTSEGFLIVQDQLSLTYFRPYTLPANFYPSYKSVYEKWHMWELLTAEQSLQFEDVQALKEQKEFLRDKVVVLLLEMKETQLKNCTDTDCDDKGEKIQFVVKPLLVSRKDVDVFLKTVGDHLTDGPNLFEDATLHDIELKRFNVPVSDITSTDVLLNTFLQIVDEATLKRLGEVLNYCYVHYKPILAEEMSNPFSNVFTLLKNTLDAIKTYNPFFIQYYYDWIDDIIKAYYEFKGKVFDVQMMCCPDENLFPLHLMLGEATKSTTVEFRSHYRNYFIYSPLFNRQKDLLAEVQQLFRRMRLLVQNFVVPNPNSFVNTPIKITPSNYLSFTLSERCIPFYYNPTPLYKSWNWNKTRKGNERYNLSWQAIQYNTADAIVNPLKYDIERFNFFRIEGHIGKNYAQALSTVVSQRNQFNLPFEVVSLSTATVARYMANENQACSFQDLEALYQVILADVICRFGDVTCMIVDIAYEPLLSFFKAGNTDVEKAFINVTDAADINVTKEFSSLLSSLPVVASDFTVLQTSNYKKGDFIKNHCAIKKGTIGEVYLSLVAKGHSFVKPSETSEINLNMVYAHLFYFIDCVENTMAVSWPVQLKDFSSSVFTSRFQALTSESEFIYNNAAKILKAADRLRMEDILRRFSVLTHTCFDERLEALSKEYKKRQTEMQALINLMNYFRQHPGMEHKAGVPKGGTFIMVYHETPRRKFAFDVATLSNANLIDAMRVNVKEAPLENINALLADASVKDPELLKRFQSALTKFVNTCEDMDDNTKADITDVLIQIPALNLPSKFNIPEYAVVADFYLPYLCCSDCAPITYVLPRQPLDTLSINIQPSEFCNDDTKAYPVTVSPAGGVLSSSGGGVDSGKLEFRPKGLKGGVSKITYTLHDGRSASVDVKISQASKTDFKFEVQPDGLTVKFYIGAKGQSAHWDFGDGVTITTDESEASHTYQFGENEKQFTVRLTLVTGPCMALAEHTFVLKKPVKIEFDIEQKVFCVNDKNTYAFTMVPAPKGLKEIKNDDKLALTRNESGMISFVPNGQKMTGSKNFTLTYQSVSLTIRVVKPDASFAMKLSRAENDSILHLEAMQKDADVFSWLIKVKDHEFKLAGGSQDVSFQKNKISMEGELAVELNVGFEIPGVKCNDRQTFVITREVIKRFLDKGQFDNSTK